MSDQALPPSSNLKDRINTALARLNVRKAYDALGVAASKQAKYALIPLGIPLMSVRPHLVESKSIERTRMGEGTGQYFHWLQTDRASIRYEADVLESSLFGPVKDGRLASPAYDLARKDQDLCNVFFALAGGMYDLQDEPALQVLQQGLADEARKVEGKPAQAFLSVAAHAPREGSMQPFRAELVLALAMPETVDTPLINLTPFELVQSNYESSGNRGKAPRLKSHMKQALQFDPD